MATDHESSFEVTEFRTPSVFRSDSLESLSTVYTTTDKAAKTAPTRGGRGAGQPKRKERTPTGRTAAKVRRSSLPDMSDFVSREDLVQIIKDTISASLSDALEPLQHEIRDLKSALLDKSQENETLRATLKEQESTIQSLGDKVDALEQYSRRSTLCLSGVKHSKWKESLPDLVDTLCKTVQVPAQDYVVKFHWVGKPKDDRGQVLIKFVNEKVRDNVLKKRKMLRDSGAELADMRINEDLTLVRRSILRELLNLRRKEKLHAVWTFNGVINFKLTENSRRKSVTTQHELNKLLESLG